MGCCHLSLPTLPLLPTHGVTTGQAGAVCSGGSGQLVSLGSGSLAAGEGSGPESSLAAVSLGSDVNTVTAFSFQSSKQIHESGTSLFFSRQTRNIPHKLNKIQGDAVAESRQRRDGKASSKEQSCSSRHRISLKAGGAAGARHVEDLMLLSGTKRSLCYHIPQTPLRVLQPLGSNGRGGPSGNQ